jgi:hypothetical protein
MKLTDLHERLKYAIQARSASKGNRDPTFRTQARIPSLARRAWMEKDSLAGASGLDGTGKGAKPFRLTH